MRYEVGDWVSILPEYQESSINALVVAEGGVLWRVDRTDPETHRGQYDDDHILYFTTSFTNPSDTAVWYGYEIEGKLGNGDK